MLMKVVASSKDIQALKSFLVMSKRAAVRDICDNVLNKHAFDRGTAAVAGGAYGVKKSIDK